MINYEIIIIKIIKLQLTIKNSVEPSMHGINVLIIYLLCI